MCLVPSGDITAIHPHFVLIEEIAPQRYENRCKQADVSIFDFLLQLFKTERMQNVTRYTVGLQIEDKTSARTRGKL